jgi:hypothetical protein
MASRRSGDRRRVEEQVLARMAPDLPEDARTDAGAVVGMSEPQIASGLHVELGADESRGDRAPEHPLVAEKRARLRGLPDRHASENGVALALAPGGGRQHEDRAALVEGRSERLLASGADEHGPAHVEAAEQHGPRFLARPVLRGGRGCDEADPKRQDGARPPATPIALRPRPHDHAPNRIRSEG